MTSPSLLDRLLLFIALSAIILGGAWSLQGLRADAEPEPEPEPYQAWDRAKGRLETPGPVDLSTVFRDVSLVIGPSVVSINRIPRQLMNSNAADHDDDRFQLSMRDMPQTVIGSGVVIDKTGYIVTNSHVATAATEIAVTLHDKRVRRATVVGIDRRSDLAVLHIRADNLVAATIGDSQTVRVGDWIMAAGSPFGLSHTVTAGIVSALGRAGVGITDYEEFIQVDAAINPGNSGGPLVNLNGHIIGINTAIASRSGSSAGIGFAIPSRMMKSVIEGLIEDGVVHRSYIGVAVIDLDPKAADRTGLTTAAGSIVEDVIRNGPADKAGIRVNDIILAVGNELVKDANTLRNRVATLKPGSELPITLWRNGRQQRVTLVLEPLSERR
ncbi:MAG: trypsin-like peptidase domain-containing protein [Planctomycetota bacterium]